MVRGQRSYNRGFSAVSAIANRSSVVVKVMLHTDICVAQFKNRYLVWLFAYMLTLPTTLESIVQLYSADTKNSVPTEDLAAFGEE